MRKQELHIYEEATNLFWGLIIVVSTTLATYILANAFVTSGWSISSLNQIIALLLFVLSFVGILKISEPLYHFVFTVEQQKLKIISYKGEQEINTDMISLNDIEGLKFSPYLPRERGEALFDFSTNYKLMYKKGSQFDYQPLIDIEDAAFTLKVDDIIKIIRFIKSYQSSVTVPREQAEFFKI
ncbi:hypothetical protein G3570_09275 [Balneolaceae bacterium YR4-1]|uniref:Uncharacterized protein n=1 Tax=Halalkalibaculum roseum TaxID=2709311 RepID=A0A6M1SVF4_9BACT|nr:hypothetical protein [Halalkalibaculum roseum]NGP76822.1 hypothetical protein [Halalkalibaculum roseum]